MTRLGGLLVVLAAGVVLTASPATAAAPARRTVVGFIQTPPAGQERRKLSGEFMSGVNEMMETIRTNGDGRWQTPAACLRLNPTY